MSAGFLKLAMLKRLLNKIRELLSAATDDRYMASDVRYTSVPVWRPWRDF
jgi:hypothetical protein